MSISVMALAWYVGDLTPAQKAVLVAIADHADDDGNRIYPSVERICIKTSYAERTVRRALADLRDIGLIHIVQEATYHSPTEYRIDLPQMQVMQNRPATNAGHALPQMQASNQTGVPENTTGVPESANRGARNAPKPSVQPPIEPPEKDRATRAEPTSPDVAEKPKKPKAPETCHDEKQTAALVERLHHVGSPATAHITETYMALADEIGLDNVLRGLTAAAEQGKQYSVKYVTACARNAQRGESGNFRNGANHATHRSNGSSTEWRSGNDAREAEPEFVPDEEFLAAVRRSNELRRQRAAEAGH